MPIIAFASSKGGVGKSTTAFHLATVLERHGASTSLIDADPNQPISKWVERFPDQKPRNLTVISATERTIAKTIDGRSTIDPFVLVDLEGTGNFTVSIAIGRADLVLIPLQASQFDADQAARVLGLIDEQQTNWKRTIPYRLFFTRTSGAIRTKVQKEIEAELLAAKIPVMATPIAEREAFRATFKRGLTLYELAESDVTNAPRAVENIESFAAEIREILLLGADAA